MRAAWALIVALAAWSVIPAWSAERTTYTEQDYHKYQLFVSCQPIRVKIEVMAPVAQRYGFSEAQLRSAVYQYLRQARVSYTDEFTPHHLSIRIQESNQVTNLSVDFTKPLVDPLTHLPGYSVTWRLDAMAPIGNEQLLAPTLEDLMGEFVQAFQGVNQGTCG